MNYKSISIHLLRRTVALVMLIAFAQSSFAGGTVTYYNKTAQVIVVPEDAGTVYAETMKEGCKLVNGKITSTSKESMICPITVSENDTIITPKSNFKFNYTLSIDLLFITEMPKIDKAKFVCCKVVNKDQATDADGNAIDNAPTSEEIEKDALSIVETQNALYPEGSNRYKITISNSGIVNGEKVKDGNADNFHSDVLPEAEKIGWHTYPDAYVYLYYGQVITDKYNLPARDESYEYVCYDRTFYKGWNSVCLPFGIKTDDFKAKLGDGCKLATFKDYNAAGNTLQFETVDEVAAGVPCLIWSDNEGAAVSLSINPTERDYVTSPVNGEYMKGTFINNSSYGKKILRLADENSFAWTSDDPMVISYRAWIEIPEGSAKALTIDIDGETTAISAVEAADTMPAKVYTANGVQTKSTVKGLNIVKASDGRVKKVMVK